MNDITQPHNYFGGQVWRVTDRGGCVRGRYPRTPGEPVTVRRIWRAWGQCIRAAAAEHGVPVPLVVACIATESGGQPGARRQEPGYVSDDETPNRVSVGLMQTLISTAREVMGTCWLVTGEWLDVPAHSIEAGVRYIKRQEPLTHFDPPLVAAAYNAGGIYEDADVRNPWRLRCYPLGTGRHVTRFVRFYNDAVAVLG